MRKLLVALAVAAIVVPTGSRAATDVSVVASGTGTMKFGTNTCSAPLTVSFHVRSNNASSIETWGPGGPSVDPCGWRPPLSPHIADSVPLPAVQQCLPGVGISNGDSYRLSQTSSTYTLQASYRLCNGKQIVDKLTFTVQSARLVFTHTYSENGVIVVNSTGNLPRIV